MGWGFAPGFDLGFSHGFFEFALVDEGFENVFFFLVLGFDGDLFDDALEFFEKDAHLVDVVVDGVGGF